MTLTDELREKICNRYREGFSCYDISRELGSVFSATKIETVLKEGKVVKRSRAESMELYRARERAKYGMVRHFKVGRSESYNRPPLEPIQQTKNKT